MIADGAEEHCLALAEELNGKFQVQICQDGFAALDLLCTFRPDIFVLDLMLPRLDGLTLLQMAQQNEVLPMTLVSTCLVNEYVTDSLTKYHVSYLMVKPYDLKACSMRIFDLAERLGEDEIQRKEPRVRVYDMLIALGMKTKLKGFAYTLEAVLFMTEDFSQQITKSLYPSVSRIFSAAVPQVERSIRNAIENAWKHRDVHIWQRYFRVCADGDVARPTNAEFITRLAHALMQ